MRGRPKKHNKEEAVKIAMHAQPRIYVAKQGWGKVAFITHLVVSTIYT